MEDSGFWNFLGLANKDNFASLEKKVERIGQGVLEVHRIWAENDKKNKEELAEIRKILSKNEERIALLLEEQDKRIFAKMEDDRTRLKHSIMADYSSMNARVGDIEKSIVDHYVKLVECITEYKSTLKSADWKIATALAQYKNDLDVIVDRIDNMDPIINLEKIEELLKMLVVNGLLQEIEEKAIALEEQENFLDDIDKMLDEALATEE